MTLLRRTLLLAATVFPARKAFAQGNPAIAALFAGRVDDGGFMEAGYRGLMAARDQLGCKVTWITDVKPQRAALEEALRHLASQSPALIIAHGGQNNEAAQAVAADFPALSFVVTQGAVKGTNLASYEVLQEQSAFLAGALAAWSTKTGVVGHMSGIRVLPGLKGRAAYAQGITLADPKVRLLTNFSGNQDDPVLSKRVALAMADAGADVVFTMLNAGRSGATDACRERGIAQIGNVVDWVASMPDVFIGSAIADSGLAVFSAAQDLVGGTFRKGMIRPIGLENPQAVRLTTAARVSPPTLAKLDQLAAELVAGSLRVSATWSGTEFPTPA